MSNNPVTAEDLYLYAMHLLDPEEHDRLDKFLLQSPEARTELANVRGDLALFAMTADAQSPSPVARQRLMKQVARERKAAPAAVKTLHAVAAAPSSYPDTGNSDRELTPLRSEAAQALTDTALPVRASYMEDEVEPRRGFAATLMPWVGWALAAGLAVSTWDLYRRTESMQDQIAFANATASRATATSAKAEAVMETLRSGASQRFMLTKQNTQPIAAARVSYLAENGTLVFQGSNLDPLPPYKTYELWLIPVGAGRQPIPAGTFKPDDRGYASVILPELPKGVVAGTFGVTMEDDGGAQSPTLPILMIGA